jgi:hypothetical protein
MTARDYRPTNTFLSASLTAFLTNSPIAIDVVLYRAIEGTEETVAEGVDEVGTMETRERKIDYADPEPIKGVIVPDDSILFGFTDDGGSPIPGEEPIVMLLSAADVPKQSVIWYEDYVDVESTEEHYLYVLKAEAVGGPPALITKYYLIPFFGFDGEGV